MVCNSSAPSSACNQPRRSPKATGLRSTVMVIFIPDQSQQEVLRRAHAASQSFRLPCRGRLPRAARQVGLCNDTQASRDRTTPPRAPTVRDPPPAGKGEKGDPVLATRRRLSLMPGEARVGITRPHSSPSPFAFPFLQKRRKEAERRQTLIRILRILRCGSRLHEARSSDGVPPRLSPKGIIPSQRLSFRPGFLGRGLNGRYPPSPVPVQGSTSRPGHSAGRLIPEPPESDVQGRPRAPHPLHLSTCLRKASFERAG